MMLDWREFFGRDLAVTAAVEEWLANRADNALPALFVIGPSGSGKSSLARAGVMPRLVVPGTVAGVDVWRTATVVCVGPLVDALARSLREADAEEFDEAARFVRLVRETRANSAQAAQEATEAIIRALDRIAEKARAEGRADRPFAARLLLLVDQLESLFAAAEQVGFTALLQRLAESGRVWLVFTLRSDRYAELQGDSALLDLKRRGIVYDLPPPGRSEIEVIVKGPARAAGLVLERRDGRSLVRKLVEDAPSADAL